MRIFALVLALAATGCTASDEKDNRRLNKGKVAGTTTAAKAPGVGDDDDDDAKGTGSKAEDADSGLGTDADTITSGGKASGMGSAASGSAGDISVTFGTGDDNPPPAEVGADGSLTYLNYAKAVLDAKCVQCHGATGKFGAFFDFSVYQTADASDGAFPHLARVKARLRLGDMPPSDAAPLPAEDRTKLQAWINASGAEGTPPPPPVPQPGGSVVQPALEFMATDAAEVFRVEAAFENTTATSKWSAYYEANATDTAVDQVIVENRPATEATFDWNTAAVASGTYFVYIVVKTGGKTAAAHSAGTVLVNHAGAGNHNPTITLSPAWNGTDAASRAFTFPADIAFNADDVDVADTLTAKIQYVNGDTLIDVVANAASPTTFHWDPLVADRPANGIAYKIRITVTDGNGGMGIAQSRQVIGLADRIYTYNADIKALLGLGTNCSPCHDTAGTRAAYFVWEVWTPNGLGAPTFGDKALERVLRTPNNPMPPGGPGPDLTKQLQLFEWQGRHEN